MSRELALTGPWQDWREGALAPVLSVLRLKTLQLCVHGHCLTGSPSLSGEPLGTRSWGAAAVEVACHALGRLRVEGESQVKPSPTGQYGITDGPKDTR